MQVLLIFWNLIIKFKTILNFKVNFEKARGSFNSAPFRCNARPQNKGNPCFCAWERSMLSRRRAPLLHMSVLNLLSPSLYVGYPLAGGSMSMGDLRACSKGTRVRWSLNISIRKPFLSSLTTKDLMIQGLWSSFARSQSGEQVAGVVLQSAYRSADLAQLMQFYTHSKSVLDKGFAASLVIVSWQAPSRALQVMVGYCMISNPGRNQCLKFLKQTNKSLSQIACVQTVGIPFKLMNQSIYPSNWLM